MIAEKVLWRAVVNQAVIDFASPGHVYGVDAASMQKSAAEWFLSDSRSLGSFLFICDILNIDPEWFRKQLFVTSSGVLKHRVATQHRSRDKLASAAVSDETVANEIAG